MKKLRAVNKTTKTSPGPVGKRLKSVKAIGGARKSMDLNVHSVNVA